MAFFILVFNYIIMLQQSQSQNNKLSSAERLKHKKRIDLLFQKGASFNAYPVQMIFYVGEPSAEPCLQVAFSVPKKHMKKAVDRNHVKRLMRESYRIQKQNLLASVKQKNAVVYLMFVYKSAKKYAYHEIEQKIFIHLQRLQNIVSNQ